MQIFKFTNKCDDTYNHFSWHPGEKERLYTRISSTLCCRAWFHGYADPLVAMLVDPWQGSYTITEPQPAAGGLDYAISSPAHLWVGEGGPDKRILLHPSFKLGMRWCRLDRRMSLPRITNQQRLAIAIRAVLASPHAKDRGWFLDFARWAENWLQQPTRDAGDYHDFLPYGLERAFDGSSQRDVLNGVSECLDSCGLDFGLSLDELIRIAYLVTGKQPGFWKHSWYRPH